MGRLSSSIRCREQTRTFDPTEPRRTDPFGPIAHEPDLAWLGKRLEAAGLHPSPIPLGVDLEAWLQGGQTPWDGHPNTGQGKMDAETCGLAEALKHPNVNCKPVPSAAIDHR